MCMDEDTASKLKEVTGWCLYGKSTVCADGDGERRELQYHGYYGFGWVTHGYGRL